MTGHRKDRGGTLGKGLMGTGFGNLMAFDPKAKLMILEEKKVENRFKLKSEYYIRRGSGCAEKRKRGGTAAGSREKEAPRQPHPIRKESAQPPREKAEDRELMGNGADYC